MSGDRGSPQPRPEPPFEERLKAARMRQGLERPAAGPEADRLPSSAMGAGLRAGLELVSALLVSVGIGLGLDTWLGTKPVFLIVFFILGAIAGFLNVWRLAMPRKSAPPPARRRDEE
jgi:ATP synthase protein I